VKGKTQIKKLITSSLPYVHLIGSICSIAGLLIVFYEPEILKNKPAVGVLAFFATIIFVFLLDGFRLRQDNAVLKLENSRNLKIRAAYSKINLGLAKINRTSRPSKFVDNEARLSERKQNLKALLNDLSNAYSLLTGGECATTIKIPIETSEGVYLRTICRDSNVKGRNYRKNILQEIDKNSSFLSIFQNLDNPDGRYFFDNNLPIRRGYKNPSFELFSNFTFQGIPDEWSDKERRKFWKLPYRSTIIVPILPHPDIEEEELDYKGFLTVDCSIEGVFDEELDVEPLIGLADGIYNYISEFMEALSGVEKKLATGEKLMHQENKQTKKEVS